MSLRSRIAHWRGLSVAKMGFCPFLGIFCHLGVYSQPPRAQQFLLSLESHSHPTSEWLEKDFDHLKKIVFIFFMIFGAWSPPAPSGQMSSPGGRPWGHLLLISVFSPLFSVYAVGYTTWCIMKLNLLLNVTQHLAEVTMLDFGYFEPFLPILTSFWLIP